MSRLLRGQEEAAAVTQTLWPARLRYLQPSLFRFVDICPVRGGKRNGRGCGAQRPSERTIVLRSFTAFGGLTTASCLCVVPATGQRGNKQGSQGLRPPSAGQLSPTLRHSRVPPRYRASTAPDADAMLLCQGVCQWLQSHCLSIRPPSTGRAHGGPGGGPALSRTG